MIGLFENDYPRFVDDIWELLRKEFDTTVTEKDVWDLARENVDVPHVGNIYCYLVFSSMQKILEDKYNISSDYYINALDTHFYINNENVDAEEIMEIINKNLVD